MNEFERLFREESEDGVSLKERTFGPRHPHRSVFSRFCQCGANITIGLISDEGLAAVEEKWTSLHFGEGHREVTRYDWLLQKLKRAA